MTGNKGRKKKTSKTSNTEKAFSMSLLLMVIFYFAQPSSSGREKSFLAFIERLKGHFLAAATPTRIPVERLMNI